MEFPLLQPPPALFQFLLARFNEDDFPVEGNQEPQSEFLRNRSNNFSRSNSRDSGFSTCPSSGSINSTTSTSSTHSTSSTSSNHSNSRKVSQTTTSTNSHHGTNRVVEIATRFARATHLRKPNLKHNNRVAPVQNPASPTKLEEPLFRPNVQFFGHDVVKLSNGSFTQAVQTENFQHHPNTVDLIMPLSKYNRTKVFLDALKDSNVTPMVEEDTLDDNYRYVYTNDDTNLCLIVKKDFKDPLIDLCPSYCPAVRFRTRNCGINLITYLECNKLSEQKYKNIIDQGMEILLKLREKGIRHNDLKLDNWMYDGDKLWIVDFENSDFSYKQDNCDLFPPKFRMSQPSCWDLLNMTHKTKYRHKFKDQHSQKYWKSAKHNDIYEHMAMFTIAVATTKRQVAFNMRDEKDVKVDVENVHGKIVEDDFFWDLWEKTHKAFDSNFTNNIDLETSFEDARSTYRQLLREYFDKYIAENKLDSPLGFTKGYVKDLLLFNIVQKNVSSVQDYLQANAVTFQTEEYSDSTGFNFEFHQEESCNYPLTTGETPDDFLKDNTWPTKGKGTTDHAASEMSARSQTAAKLAVPPRSPRRPKQTISTKPQSTIWIPSDEQILVLRHFEFKHPAECPQGTSSSSVALSEDCPDQKSKDSSKASNEAPSFIGAVVLAASMVLIFRAKKLRRLFCSELHKFTKIEKTPKTKSKEVEK